MKRVYLEHAKKVISDYTLDYVYNKETVETYDNKNKNGISIMNDKQTYNSLPSLNKIILKTNLYILFFILH